MAFNTDLPRERAVLIDRQASYPDPRGGDVSALRKPSADGFSLRTRLDMLPKMGAAMPVAMVITISTIFRRSPVCHTRSGDKHGESQLGR